MPSRAKSTRRIPTTCTDQRDRGSAHAFHRTVLAQPGISHEMEFCAATTDRAASQKRGVKEDAPLASAITGSSDRSLMQTISGTCLTKLAWPTSGRGDG